MQTGVQKNCRVLIADDQADIHQDFEEMLKPGFDKAADDLAGAFLPDEENRKFLPDFELIHAASGEEACSLIEGGAERGLPISVAYVDIRMPPGMDGIETVRRIRKIDRNIEIVLMTAYTDVPLAEIVHEMELLHKLLYIRKPVTRDEIQQISSALVAKWNLEREVEDGRRKLLASHRRLEAVIDTIEEAIGMWGTDDRLVFANRGYTELMDLTENQLKEMSGEEVTQFLKKRFRERELFDPAPDPESGTAGRPRSSVVETTGDGPAGRRLFLRTERPVRNGAGAALGDLYVYRDVSKDAEYERIKAEVLRLRAEVEVDTAWGIKGMVGSSAAMREVYALTRRAAGSGISVLIRGESGTGKELLAKALHSGGPRKAGPFVAVNCAAIPETLIETELFGHERGAFTGAGARRTGCFEWAQGGTLLLDEIADMPAALQSKLLRVLQEREIQRVGGAAAVPIDVRVIAATNRSLEEAIGAGKFRSDLYYRIAAFPITIPPLRERRDDIPLLVDHFVKESAQRGRKPIDGVSTGALRLLVQYDWPGNVRELQGGGRTGGTARTDERTAGRQPAAPVDRGRTGRPAGSRAGSGGDRTQSDSTGLERVRQQHHARGAGPRHRSIDAAPEAEGAGAQRAHRRLRITTGREAERNRATRGKGGRNGPYRNGTNPTGRPNATAGRTGSPHYASCGARTVQMPRRRPAVGSGENGKTHRTIEPNHRTRLPDAHARADRGDPGQ